MQVKYLKPILVAGTLIGLSQWSGLSFAQTADQLYKRGLAATCANCHGTNGKVVSGSPVIGLAGLPADYIVSQMKAFKSGARPATVMHQLSKGYSDEQIEQLAAYFAALKK